MKTTTQSSVREVNVAAKQFAKTRGPGKRRDQFLAVFLGHLKKCHINTDEKTLVIGGTWEDVELLAAAGFEDITLSNLQTELEEGGHRNLGLQVKRMAVDAEQADLPDDSFDCVFAHEVLHHCRSPHRGLCEMLRVARKHVVMLEPNDSFFMGALTWAGFSFPYEIFSVVYHRQAAGGVRNSCVPNFIYRWTANEVRKTVSSYLPEYKFLLHAYPHWDFNVNAEHLSMRRETRIRWITSVMRADLFLGFLRALQAVFNLIPPVRRQGNKFFCCIEKTGRLQPWLTNRNGKIGLGSGFRSDAG